MATSKEFEKLVLSQRIDHFGNPVLRWMLASTVVKTDPAVADAILDRIVHTAHQIELTGESIRKMYARISTK